jgi:hypothetical protein
MAFAKTSSHPGGGPGIMEAAYRGADDAGAPSIGFSIVLPTEQEPNGYPTPSLTFRFHWEAVVWQKLRGRFAKSKWPPDRAHAEGMKAPLHSDGVV